MTVESATYISGLNASYPEGNSVASELDNHLRLIKSTLLATFPSITGAVSATHTELNVLDGITATVAELNILDGVTATTAELNYMDGVTSAVQTQLNAKAASLAFTVSAKDDNFTAAASNHYVLRTNSSKTATLPATPSQNDTVKITNTSGGSWTAARNGENIMGAASDVTMVTNKHYEFVYIDATTGWAATRSGL